jgi:hypothetical protein
MSVTETGNPYSPSNYVHTIDAIDSSTETQVFPSEDCYIPDYIEYKNVTDQYTYSLKAENLPTPNWSSSLTLLDFFKEMVFKLSIVDASSFVSQDLQIKSVHIAIYDSNRNEMTKVKFNVNDKLALMNFSSNPYYKDGHFCRYKENNECVPFYDISSTRTNAYVETVLSSRISEICQTTIDDTKTDFFTVFLPQWVERLDTSSVGFHVTVRATIRQCDSILFSNSATPGYEIMYVEASSYIVLGGTTEDPSPAPTRAPRKSERKNEITLSANYTAMIVFSGLIIGLIIGNNIK